MYPIHRRLILPLACLAIGCGSTVATDEGGGTSSSSDGTTVSPTSTTSASTTSASTTSASTTTETTTSASTTMADDTGETTTGDVTATTSDASSSTTDASSSSTGDMGEIYASFDQFVTWDQALASCESRGGTLATIHSDPENAAVLDMCDETTGGVGPDTGCWVGLATPWDAWTDETALDYENWSPTNPNGNGECGWLYIEAAAGAPGEWDDYLCDWETSFVCRLPADGDVDGAAAVTAVP